LSDMHLVDKHASHTVFGDICIEARDRGHEVRRLVEGVVEQAVDPTPFAKDRVHPGIDRRAIEDVHLDSQSLAAHSLDLLDRDVETARKLYRVGTHDTYDVALA